jgi:hypothetical protein
MNPAQRALCLAPIVALGCGRAALLPEQVPLDRVSCARCGMLVSDPSSAAEVVFGGAETRFYDDPGCLATDRIPEGQPHEIWVRADGGKAWKKAREAFYARPRDARTPMGYGFLAFTSREDARSRDRDGKAWGWEQVRAEISHEGGKAAGGSS